MKDGPRARRSSQGESSGAQALAPKRASGDGGGRGPPMRRPTWFWQRFNAWWRSELDRLGKRPSKAAVEAWYTSNADAVWPVEQPSFAETRMHAKCLRSTAAVREYFRRYRAARRGEVYHSQDEDEGDAGESGGDDGSHSDEDDPHKTATLRARARASQPRATPPRRASVGGPHATPPRATPPRRASVGGPRATPPPPRPINIAPPPEEPMPDVATLIAQHNARLMAAQAEQAQRQAMHLRCGLPPASLAAGGGCGGWQPPCGLPSPPLGNRAARASDTCEQFPLLGAAACLPVPEQLRLPQPAPFGAPGGTALWAPSAWPSGSGSASMSPSVTVSPAPGPVHLCVAAAAAAAAALPPQDGSRRGSEWSMAGGTGVPLPSFAVIDTFAATPTAAAATAAAAAGMAKEEEEEEEESGTDRDEHDRWTPAPMHAAPSLPPSPTSPLLLGMPTFRDLCTDALAGGAAQQSVQQQSPQPLAKRQRCETPGDPHLCPVPGPVLAHGVTLLQPAMACTYQVPATGMAYDAGDDVSEGDEGVPEVFLDDPPSGSWWW